MQEIIEFNPEIVCLSTTFVLTQKQLNEIGRLLRHFLGELFLIAGGHHVFTALKYLSKDQRADYLVDSKFDGFVYDTFNVPRDRFETLIDRMIEEDLVMPWYSFLRCQYIDETLVKKMKKSGCAGVFLGMESGANKILKNMKKGAIVDFYRDGIRWLKANGILTVGSFIVGFPGETEETVSETQTFIEKSGLDYYFIQPFYYLHHTPVHLSAEKYGLTGNGLYWSHDTMDWKVASGHINRLFMEIKNSTFVNPDYTLWEIAYLQSKGLLNVEIMNYRKMINRMTRDQMERFGFDSSPVTSRVN
jgi:anaerobic magnesium-protoporphyrin IX monomethyl ester cyclase